MAENFPNLKKEMGIHMHKAQNVSNEMNPKKPRWRLIKTVKSQRQEILKVARENNMSHTKEQP